MSAVLTIECVHGWFTLAGVMRARERTGMRGTLQ